MKEEIVIYLECPKTTILGVFNKGIHLLTHGYINREDEEGEEEIDEDFECILIVPESVYINEWRKWIKGKREYCERFDHYCGVMGYVFPENPIFEGTQKINKYNIEKGDYDIIEVSVYSADKFNNKPGFEHG